MHLPRPITLYFQETHPPPFKRGTNDFARFYGLLIDGLQMSYVNGFGYKQVLPAPASEIPQRFARAEQVIKNKLWREQLLDWDANCKPVAVAKHRELQAVEPDALSDAELVDLSDTLSRPPFVHDRAAHALHRWCRAADLGFSGPRWRLDGFAALGSAGTDARLG